MQLPRLYSGTRWAALWLGSILVAGCGTISEKTAARGPWDLQALKQTPTASWGTRTGLVQEAYYAGEPYRGKPTRIFAYLGRPAGAGPFPGMVLVHGGGGKAFAKWAEHWAARGYVALAMDTAGCGPEGRLSDGGPDQSDAEKFQEFSETEIRDQWSYHAVAAVIRGHSLLASQPEVDRERIGITGISWGGYLTCIVAGLDERLKVAVPVYGCGFLGENSHWKTRSLARLSPDSRARWLRNFDPSQYLPKVRCPILFLNGTTDFAYPLDSYRASYRSVSPRFRHVSVILNLPHGHIWTFKEVDAFVDSVLRDGQPLPHAGALRITTHALTAEVSAPAPIARAELFFTNDTGEWQQRRWESLPAQVEGKSIMAPLPPKRPATVFFGITDGRGLRVSTEHEELP